MRVGIIQDFAGFRAHGIFENSRLRRIGAGLKVKDFLRVGIEGDKTNFADAQRIAFRKLIEELFRSGHRRLITCRIAERICHGV